jgi:hypothetical protein
MKQRFVSSIIFSAALLVSACNQEDETPTNTNTSNPPSGSFTYKVDGTGVTIDSARAVLYTSVVTSARQIDVYAYKGAEQVLEFHFPPRTGTYPAAQSFTNAWLTHKAGSVSYHSTSGTLNLTVCDTSTGRFEATFNFVGQQSGGSATKNITEGNMVVTRFNRQ